MRRILRRAAAKNPTAPNAECPRSATSDLASVMWLHPSLLLTNVG